MNKRLAYRLAVTLACGLPTLVLGQSPTATPEALDSARSTLAKWVETQQIISKEKRDWQEGKEVLEQRISLLEGEIASLREKTAQSQGGIDESAARQRELESQNRGLREAAASLEQIIGELETKTRALLAAVPEPLARRVEPLSRVLPRDPAKSELSLSTRYQNVLGILNEINKFNREVFVTREMRDLPDGSKAEVQTLYLGLGQAYYVSPDGKAAGTGEPGPAGWTWTASNELAGEIAKAIAILQNKDVPEYVPLPVQVD